MKPHPHLLSRALLLLASLCPLLSWGQAVIGTAGNEHSNANGGIAYTIGEVVIPTAVGSQAVLTQGFHQPWVSISTVVEEDGTASAGNALVYPNPTRHELFVEVDDALGAETFLLLNAAGQRVLDGRITGPRTALDLSSYADGAYHLHLADRTGTPLRTFTLIVSK